MKRETAEKIVRELNKYSRAYDRYEYGLPLFNEHIEAMIQIVLDTAREDAE